MDTDDDGVIGTHDVWALVTSIISADRLDGAN
jgi:hypothetical protein